MIAERNSAYFGNDLQHDRVFVCECVRVKLVSPNNLGGFFLECVPTGTVAGQPANLSVVIQSSAT